MGEWGMRFLVLAGLMLCAGVAQAATAVDVAAFIKRDGFDDIKISPNGEYYAASAVFPRGRSVLVVIRRSDKKPVARFNLGKNKYVYDFAWVNPTLAMLAPWQRSSALLNARCPLANCTR